MGKDRPCSALRCGRFDHSGRGSSEPSNNRTTPTILSGHRAARRCPRQGVGIGTRVGQDLLPPAYGKDRDSISSPEFDLREGLPVHRGHFKHPQGADLHIRKVEAQIRKGEGTPGRGTKHLIPVRSNLGDELLDLVPGHQVFPQNPVKIIEVSNSSGTTSSAPSS